MTPSDVLKLAKEKGAKIVDPRYVAKKAETWIEYKRKNEVDAIRLRPHRSSSPSTSTSEAVEDSIQAIIDRRDARLSGT